MSFLVLRRWGACWKESLSQWGWCQSQMTKKFPSLRWCSHQKDGISLWGDDWGRWGRVVNHVITQGMHQSPQAPFWDMEIMDMGLTNCAWGGMTTGEGMGVVSSLSMGADRGSFVQVTLTGLEGAGGLAEWDAFPWFTTNTCQPTPHLGNCLCCSMSMGFNLGPFRVKFQPLLLQNKTESACMVTHKLVACHCKHHWIAFQHWLGVPLQARSSSVDFLWSCRAIWSSICIACLCSFRMHAFMALLPSKSAQSSAYQISAFTCPFEIASLQVRLKASFSTWALSLSPSLLHPMKHLGEPCQQSLWSQYTLSRWWLPCLIPPLAQLYALPRFSPSALPLVLGWGANCSSICPIMKCKAFNCVAGWCRLSWMSNTSKSGIEKFPCQPHSGS